jgi:6-phosphogluconolactonase (cycloisomerase 2 family)
MKTHQCTRGLRLAVAAFCLVTLLVSFGRAQNLLINPGFETGDFTGWTLSGNSSNFGVNVAGFLITGTDEGFGPTYVVVNSGTYAGYTLVCAGCSPPPYGEYLELSQPVTLSPGYIYNVGLWVGDGSSSGYGDSVSIFVDGNPVQLTSHPVIEPGYQFVGGSFTALHNSSVVTFLIDGSGSGVAGFSFDDLTLTVVGPAPSNDGYAYVVNQSADTVSSYQINFYTGALTLGTGSPFPTGDGPIALAVRGNLVYVADHGSSQISGYTTDPMTGNMTPINGSPVGAGLAPNSIAISPSRNFLYASGVDPDGRGAVSGWSYSPASGVLTPIPGSPFLAGSSPGAIAFSRFGVYAYVADVTNDQLLAYSLDQNTGLLTAIGSFSTGSNPSAVAVDTIGNFLYVANEGDNNVSAYQIGSDGSLTPVAGSPFAAGTAPQALAFSGHQQFLYAANSGSADISGYQIDGSTGTLTSISGSPFLSGSAVNSITNARGNFLYANATDGIWGYMLDPGSGALMAVQGSPFSGQGTAIATTGGTPATAR